MNRRLLAACLLALLSTVALAASEPVDKPEADARLDQKVTIRAVGRPLCDVLKELTAQTGVRMTAKKDATDIKAVVLVRDTPLSSLKDALKDCLHLQCTREGKKDEWTYNFWEDMKTRQDADKIKQAEIRKLRDHLDKLARELAEIEAEGKDPVKALGSLSPEVCRRLESDDPDRYGAYQAFWSSGGTLATVTAYTGFSKAQVQALWAGEKVGLRIVDMSSELGKKFGARANAFIAMAHANDWRSGGQETTGPRPAGGMTLSLDASGWHNKPCLIYTIFGASANGDDELTADASSIIDAPEEDNPSEEQVTSADSAKADTRPDLKLKITPQTTLYDAMEQVFELTGTCMVADYYTRVKQPGVIHGVLSDHPSFKTADDVLKQAAKDTLSELGRTGEIRVFSSKSWPSDRDREIPERLLVKWRAVHKQYGGLRIQEALEMANLSKLQLKDLELYKTGYGWAIIFSQAAIRVAGSLTSGQWQTAMSEQGLSTSEMNASQLALVQAWTRASEEFTSSAKLTDELSDPQRLRSCVLRILYKGHGEKDDDIKAQWEFELYPPSYYEAIRQGALAATSPDAVIAVPAPQCRGHIRLADLNQPRGWPAPEESKDTSQ